MKNFALIGAAGYIAERHLRAVKETNNNILAATDAFDVMGRMDSFFPDAEFFTDYTVFENFIREQQKTSNPIDYFSICSPNYLHITHILSALNNGASAICEKPLVLYPSDIELLEKTERETGKKVYNILQLRLHKTIIELKNKIDNGPKDTIYDIDLTYITSRGKWYYKSWKGDVKKSGGVATNIGIHFFDMLMWIFGEVQHSTVNFYEATKAAGFMQLERARVRWYLSLDYSDIPQSARDRGMRTYRSITVDGDEIEFSGGFTDLHTQSYENILGGGGFGLDQAKKSIILTDQIRNAAPIGLKGEYHPFSAKYL
jgi:UDP-N-acetyl-2-amino-2-deoxyglucuronate dehydrogenase